MQRLKDSSAAASLPISVRDAVVSDVAAAYALECAAQHAPWSETSLRSALQPPYCWRVATDAANAAGAVLGHTVAVQALDELQLLSLAVLPEWRRQGYARVLLRDLQQQAQLRQCAHIFCEVRCSNDAAIALYHGLGFETLGQRWRFYAPITPSAAREDALLLRCRVSA